MTSVKVIERPTVLAVHLRDDGIMDGCNHYRFRIPFEAIRAHNAGASKENVRVVDWAPLTRVREWAADQSKKVHPSDYDIVLLPRHRPLPYGYEDTATVEEIPDELWRAVAELGVKAEKRSHLLDLVHVLRTKQAVVAEYDDDYFTGSRDLRYEYLELLHEFLGIVDAVTVSTPYLVKLIRRYAPTVPVYELPNCVTWSEWQGHERFPRVPDDAIVVGLTGSSTDKEDWRVMETVIPRIMKDFGNVYFMTGGYQPEYLAPVTDQYPDRCEHYPPLDYADYPALIRQFDIVLCPVVPEDEFNLSKSPIKAIEGMAAGRTLPDGRQGGGVPITSDLYYYRRATGGDKRGLTVAHTPEAWYDAIAHLIRNKELREKLQRKGHHWTHENHAIETKWYMWWNAYREIHNRRKHNGSTNR
jgi:glycosyltransferase involved in cell wall biosynthesis